MLLDSRIAGQQYPQSFRIEVRGTTARMQTLSLPLIDDGRPGIPVIVVAGYRSVESAVNAMRGGACDCITKPITRQKLLDSVNWAREALATYDSS